MQTLFFIFAAIFVAVNAEIAEGPLCATQSLTIYTLPKGEVTKDTIRRGEQVTIWSNVNGWSKIGENKWITTNYLQPCSKGMYIEPESYPLGDSLNITQPMACPKCCELLPKRSPLSYTYYQSTGKFVGGSGQWKIDTKGYSGNGKGRNNPAMQCEKNVGPLPVNVYKLSHCQDYMHGSTPRPCSFVLSPTEPSKMCGRSDFLVHGCQSCTSCDNMTPPCGTCSAGCVVIPVHERMKLRVGDTVTVVH
jgi:hypothetical protein